MEDKLTPIEAEVLEYSAEPEAPELPSDSYGTAVLPRTKKNYVGLWICLGLVIIAICSLGVASAVRSIRIQRSPEGGWTVTMGAPGKQNEDDPVKNLPSSTKEDVQQNTEAVPGNTARIQLDRTRSPAEKTADAVYAAVSPSVVSLDVTSSYGTLTYTGVVLSSDGYILSATDGLSSALSVKVRLPDGTVCSATRVGEEKRSGVCLVKIDAKELTPAVFASAEELPVGSRIYCIANPYGAVLPNVLSDGLLSAKQTAEVDGSSYQLLHTSSELQSSGYGCPIVDGSGRIVGMTTAIGRYLVSGTDPCFALSGSDLQRIVAAFSSSGSRQDLWLGLTVEEIPERYSRLYSYPGSLWLTAVSERSGFAGVLFPYDVVTAVNGVPVSTLAEYHAALEQCRAGDTVRLTIYRSGKYYYADLKVLRK